MLAYISGKIAAINPAKVVIDTGGLGYECNISLHTFSQIQNATECKLYTHLYMKHEGQNLSAVEIYAFAEEDEKELFGHLLSVSGVGASTARMMLSSLSPKEIKHAILTDNENAIKSVKGIGPKSAKRLILELKDKLGKTTDTAEISLTPSNTSKDEALSALVSLGFSKNLAEKALNKTIKQHGEGSLSVEELIKQTLKSL